MIRKDSDMIMRLLKFMNIFHHNFNNNLIDDNNIVSDASGILDVSEFKIFQMAFYAWFGEDGNYKFIESCFGSYLKDNKLPIWVRNYARRIVNDYNRNIFKAEKSRKKQKKKLLVASIG